VIDGGKWPVDTTYGAMSALKSRTSGRIAERSLRCCPTRPLGWQGDLDCEIVNKQAQRADGKTPLMTFGMQPSAQLAGIIPTNWAVRGPKSGKAPVRRRIVRVPYGFVQVCPLPGISIVLYHWH
jgi:hypothetical protein